MKGERQIILHKRQRDLMTTSHGIRFFLTISPLNIAQLHVDVNTNF